MGFKPKSVLADYLNMRSPYFLYPHEVGVRVDYSPIDYSPIRPCVVVADSRYLRACAHPQDGVTGSTVAFRALQEKMIELEKVAIVRMIMRDGSAPRFCALLAQVRHAPLLVDDRPIQGAHLLARCASQKEVRDDEGWVDTPTGMFMIPLPYSDDIRELHVPPAPKRACFVRRSAAVVCVLRTYVVFA